MVEYWQILIGPWLNTFITVLFDRWESITKAYKSLDRLQTLVLDFSEEKMIPYHSLHFKQVLSASDPWNHFIFSKIIEFQGYKFELLEPREETNFRKNEKKLRKSPLSILATFARFIRDFMYTRKEDVFLELRERTELANKSNADLFLSIHCDGFKNSNDNTLSAFNN